MNGLSLNNWLLWSVPLAVINPFLLLVVVFKLVNQMKRSELFSVPLAQETLVEFKESGKFQLHMAGPRFTTAFAGLVIRLINVSNNQEVQISRRVFPVSSSGLSEVRMLYGSVKILEAGRYILSVRGLKEARDYTGCRILVTHPYTLYALTCFIGIMLSGFGFIIGLVMSLIYLGKTPE